MLSTGLLRSILGGGGGAVSGLTFHGGGVHRGFGSIGSDWSLGGGGSGSGFDRFGSVKFRGWRGVRFDRFGSVVFGGGVGFGQAFSGGGVFGTTRSVQSSLGGW